MSSGGRRIKKDGANQMQPTEWLASFETGSSLIDDQHRELLAYLSKLKDLMESGRGEEAHAECLTFRKMFEAHYADEEELLRQAGFPRMDAHLATHEESRQSLNGVFSSCGAACKNNTSGGCIEELLSILVHHFLKGDMDFKSFLQTRGLADNGH